MEVTYQLLPRGHEWISPHYLQVSIGHPLEALGIHHEQKVFLEGSELTDLSACVTYQDTYVTYHIRCSSFQCHLLQLI